ncbi:MAG: hypothetical protein GX997_03135 [Bacteroidales bacterium]|nr:hypothetical protein [Bacteroidales bacterium]
MKRNSRVLTVRNLSKVGAALERGWCEDGAALVRGRCGLGNVIGCLVTFTVNANKNQDDTCFAIRSKVSVL